jgi:DNA-binding transcriptional ArsR family regulator
MKELERQLKALANKRRLAILKFLKKKGQAPVGEIAAEIGLSFKATSRHLAVLASADIVDKEQKGLLVFYHLSSVQKSITKYLISIL